MEVAMAASDDVKKYISLLEDNILRFEKKVAVLEQENNYLQEKLRLALYRQFGRHAEKFVGEGQPPLFDADEAAVPKGPEPAKGTETVNSYNRVKRGRKPIDEHIPRLDEVIDITEGDKQCACGNPLTCIGEDVTERLVMIPEQVYVLRYHVKKYA
ncbi:MAG: IS66 family transposase zinc-finger binding domain-containing protein, partial [Treponema sp.]|nr:IS66 family transposase zinc-finger binding domain-containing protein [Treponema sp.]